MKVSMKESKPYRKMGATCRTRAPGEKRMTWVKPDAVLDDSGGYRVSVLRRELIESASALWRAAYPEVCGSPHQFLLEPDLYEGLIAVEETWEEDARGKVYCMPVVEDLATGRVVAATLLTKFEGNLQVEFSFAATDPDYRGRNLTSALRRMTRRIARDTGAEYFTTFCETWHDITQNWCLKEGWKIAGIFPGNFVRWNGEGEEYRGCEIHFYRFVGEGEEHSTRPEEWVLAPEVREVWEVIEKVNRRLESVHQERIRQRAEGKAAGNT